jgi:hypothetical protein
MTYREWVRSAPQRASAVGSFDAADAVLPVAAGRFSVRPSCSCRHATRFETGAYESDPCSFVALFSRPAEREWTPRAPAGRNGVGSFTRARDATAPITFNLQVVKELLTGSLGAQSDRQSVQGGAILSAFKAVVK